MVLPGFQLQRRVCKTHHHPCWACWQALKPSQPPSKLQLQPTPRALPALHKQLHPRKPADLLRQPLNHLPGCLKGCRLSHTLQTPSSRSLEPGV